MLLAGWVGLEIVRLTVPLPPTGSEIVSSWWESEDTHLLMPAIARHDIADFVDLLYTR